MSVPKNGSSTTTATQNAFQPPPMSSRRKMSTSANAHTMASGRKMRKRKNVSQKVVATTSRYSPGLGAGPRGFELRGLVCGDEADADEVHRADEAVRDAESTGTRDGVAQRYCPVVLDQEQRGRGVGRDL